MIYLKIITRKLDKYIMDKNKKKYKKLKYKILKILLQVKFLKKILNTTKKSFVK